MLPICKIFYHPQPFKMTHHFTNFSKHIRRTHLFVCSVVYAILTFPPLTNSILNPFLVFFWVIHHNIVASATLILIPKKLSFLVLTLLMNQYFPSAPGPPKILPRMIFLMKSMTPLPHPYTFANNRFHPHYQRHILLSTSHNHIYTCHFFVGYCLPH